MRECVNAEDEEEEDGCGETLEPFLRMRMADRSLVFIWVHLHQAIAGTGNSVINFRPGAAFWRRGIALIRAATVA